MWFMICSRLLHITKPMITVVISPTRPSDWNVMFSDSSISARARSARDTAMKRSERKFTSADSAPISPVTRSAARHTASTGTTDSTVWNASDAACWGQRSRAHCRNTCAVSRTT